MRACSTLLILLAAWVAAGGCATPDTGRKLAWRIVSKGLVSGLSEPGRRVVRSEGEFYTLWATHAADANQVALPPAVDFRTEMLLVVTLGDRPTGGYVVDLVDVELRGRVIRVLVGEREPRPGTFQIQQATRPYVMAALPAMAARVEFRTVKEEELRRGRRKARPGVEGPGDSGEAERRIPGGDAPPGSGSPPVPRSGGAVVPLTSPRGAVR